MRKIVDFADVIAFFILMAFVALTTCISCGHGKADESVEPVAPSQADVDLYKSTESAILAKHVYGGFGIVTLTPDEKPEHQGEALIWGGTFLGVATCDGGRDVSFAMASMVDRLDGQIIRVDPLGEYANGRQATMDGMIGLMAGVARRVVNCGEADLWARPWFKLTTWQGAHGGKLNAGSKAKLEGEFKYIRDLIAWKLGLRDKPEGSRRWEFQKTAAAWPGLVLIAHKTGIGSDACFRVNLSWTAITTTEVLGDTLGDDYRDRFCKDTKSMGMPTVDHYCGRKSIAGYIASYVPNEWEYRFQRCAPPWERPDGDGDTTPPLDLLVALVLKHGWEPLQPK